MYSFVAFHSLTFHCVGGLVQAFGQNAIQENAANRTHCKQTSLRHIQREETSWGRFFWLWGKKVSYLCRMFPEDPPSSCPLWLLVVQWGCTCGSQTSVVSQSHCQQTHLWDEVPVQENKCSLFTNKQNQFSVSASLQARDKQQKNIVKLTTNQVAGLASWHRWNGWLHGRHLLEAASPVSSHIPLCVCVWNLISH